MTKRVRISAADLFVLLESSFRRRMRRGCTRCAVTMPYSIHGRNGLGANWEIIPPFPCPERCLLELEQVVAELQVLYDLSDPEA